MNGRRPLPPQQRKQLLPPAVEQQLRELLADGATRDEAAAAVGISRRRLDTRLADQLADLRVGRGRQGASRRRPRGMDAARDLTAAEIELRAFYVRQAWPLERWLNGPPQEPGTGPAGSVLR